MCSEVDAHRAAAAAAATTTTAANAAERADEARRNLILNYMKLKQHAGTMLSNGSASSGTISSDLAMLEKYTKGKREITVPGLSEPFIISQDWNQQIEGQSGAIVWESSVVLGELLVQHFLPNIVTPSSKCSVIELGCGIGMIPSLACASYGTAVNVVATDIADIVMQAKATLLYNTKAIEHNRVGKTKVPGEHSDSPSGFGDNREQNTVDNNFTTKVMPTIGDNCEDQASIVSNIRVEEMDWNRLSLERSTWIPATGFDLVIAADVIHYAPNHWSFATLVNRLLRLNPNSICVLVYQERKLDEERNFVNRVAPSLGLCCEPISQTSVIASTLGDGVTIRGWVLRLAQEDSGLVL